MDKIKIFLLINLVVIMAGAAFGLTMPLVTVILENRGVSATIIGDNHGAIPVLYAVS